MQQSGDPDEGSHPRSYRPIRFDKKVTRSSAVEEFRDTIHGTFFPNEYRCGAGEMTIKSVRSSASMPAKSLPKR
tara:strand:- start:2399 stop:2620 length:222 start_codon:yes stop_codon:yes gene_type:complete